MSDLTQVDYDNFFDNLGANLDAKEAFKQQSMSDEAGKKLDYLIHHVFQQDEKGRELFKIWKDVLLMTPTVQSGFDNFAAGIEEGKKTFIRNIMLTINKVERGD
jgi:hypothetical protein